MTLRELNARFVLGVNEYVRVKFPSLRAYRHTIETWLEQIANYFLERLTSRFVEGFNNRVKVLKRRCYGIFDVYHLFQRLTLDIHGYQRFTLT